jgi:hypothetical protein
MPPQMKEAAKALVGIIFFEPAPGETGYEGLGKIIACRSINDALLYLLLTGMRQALPHIEYELTKCQQADEVFKELVSFFLKHPAARHALPANFAEGSEARRFIERVIWDYECLDSEQDEDERPIGPEPPPTIANESESGWLKGQYARSDGYPRESATTSFADNQQTIFKLTAAKGAIQKALSLSRRPKRISDS